MRLKDLPMHKKLRRTTLIITGVVLVITCSSFFICQYYSFKAASSQNLLAIARVIAANSTAALAFDNREDAAEILDVLKVEPHVTTAALYKDGHLFVHYPDTLNPSSFPEISRNPGLYYRKARIEVFQPVLQNQQQLGTLYIQADRREMFKMVKLYITITAIAVVISLLLIFFLSKVLQNSILLPILALADTAQAIAVEKDYSVRAVKQGKDELGLLTDAFNQMLEQIHHQNESLFELNHTLEEKVEERTLELQAINSELESFSYSISHDLRAPLRAVNGYAEMLHEDYYPVLDDEAKRIITSIQYNATRMGVLIDDLLAFSRLGRKEVQKSRIDMNLLTQNVLAEIERTIPHHATIKVGQLDTVKADPDLIFQVMFNLIANAIKYSSKKEHPLVEIFSERTKEAVVFSVRDNGAGFEMQYSDKLFGVFQRLHRTKEFEGTGVGLAIVKRIIAKHGGQVGAQGEVGKGALFYFTLPIQ
jgi:signal transduction histidine kinase